MAIQANAGERPTGFAPATRPGAPWRLLEPAMRRLGVPAAVSGPIRATEPDAPLPPHAVAADGTAGSPDRAPVATVPAVIGVLSAKGGVGKTTIAVELAWRAAVGSGHRTLLWDLDPQGGATWLLGRAEPPGQRAAGVVQREGRPLAQVVPTEHPGLALLPADQSLRGLGLALARLGQRRRLAQVAGQLAHDFARIVIDCPPQLGDVADQVVAAADVLIVPLQPSPLALRTLEALRREIVALHPRHPPILPVLSMFDARRQLHREVAAGLAAGWPVVPMASVIEQMAARRQPLGRFAPWSEPAHRLQALWDGIEARLAQR